MKLKISLRLTTFIFCALAIIAAVLSFINTQNVDLKIHEQADRLENHNQCEDKILEFSNASDDLTTATRHFVATGDPIYMNQYWQEADVFRHREDAVASLNALGISTEEQTLLSKAMDASNRLMKTETLAMRLKADAVGIPEMRCHPRWPLISIKTAKKAAVRKKRNSWLSEVSLIIPMKTRKKKSQTIWQCSETSCTIEKPVRTPSLTARLSVH